MASLKIQHVSEAKKLQFCDLEDASEESEESIDQDLKNNGKDEEKTWQKKGNKELGLPRIAQGTKSCSHRVYLLVIFILVGFLLAEYIVQLKINYQNTQKFLKNMKTLKNSFNQQYPHTPNAYLRVDSSVGSSQSGRQQIKLNFKQNQANGRSDLSKTERRSSTPILIKGQENDVLPITGQPQGENGAPVGQPQLANEQQLQYRPVFHPPPPPSPVLSQEPYRPSNLIMMNEPMNPIALNQHLDQNNEDVYIPPQPSYQIAANTLDGLPQYPSLDIPKQNNLFIPVQGNVLPSVAQTDPSISPTIKPFNPEIPPTPNDPYTSFAGISNDQMVKIRERHQLTFEDISASPSPTAQQELAYYQSRYKISNYQQLPFCVVVPTFNNAPNNRYLHNINSILMQNYTNFHIVVMDDHSEDNTGELIRKRLETQQKVPPERYKIIRNDRQMRAMENLRTAAKEHCGGEEIFMVVDGDDELLGRQVFKVFNAVFQEKKLWFVYSNFLSTTGAIGFSRPFPVSTIKQNNYRSYPFVTSHLRAFYTKLFVNVNQEDLKDDQGEYFKAANDVAICIPVLQQAHQRVAYLPQVTYYYNSNTGINNHQLRLQEQRNNDHKTRTRQRYHRLEVLGE